MSHLTAKDYQTALDVQNACNLSGVVYSFADIMQRLCKDVPDTAARNRHPICVLFAEQIKWLTLSELDFGHAWDACRDQAAALASAPENLDVTDCAHYGVCDDCGISCPPEGHFGTPHGHYCASCYRVYRRDVPEGETP